MTGSDDRPRWQIAADDLEEMINSGEFEWVDDVDLEAMQQWIIDAKHVTDAQVEAIRNIAAARDFDIDL